MQCSRNQEAEPGGTGLLSWQLSGRKDALHHEADVSSAPTLGILHVTETLCLVITVGMFCCLSQLFFFSWYCYKLLLAQC